MTICVCNTCNTPMNFRDMYCPKCHPDGMTLFEGVTKEAHEKLKQQNALLVSENERLREALSEIGAGCKWPMGNSCDSCFSHLNPYCNDYSKIARKAMEGRDG